MRGSFYTLQALCVLKIRSIIARDCGFFLLHSRLCFQNRVVCMWISNRKADFTASAYLFFRFPLEVSRWGALRDICCTMRRRSGHCFHFSTVLSRIEKEKAAIVSPNNKSRLDITSWTTVSTWRGLAVQHMHNTLLGGSVYFTYVADRALIVDSNSPLQELYRMEINQNNTFCSSSVHKCVNIYKYTLYIYVPPSFASTRILEQLFNGFCMMF